MSKWRGRYARDRLPGLYDELRPRRPRTVGDERIAELINKTLHTKPTDGSTHWSMRTLASETCISTRARLRAISKFSRSSRIGGKLQVIYRSVVHREAARRGGPVPASTAECSGAVRRREKSVQVLERTQAMLPMGLDYVEGVTHDHVRHRTSTLFAALNVFNEEVLGQLQASPPPSGISVVPARNRQGRAARSGCALCGEQLGEPQASEGACLAGAASTLTHAVCADLSQLAQSGRALLWNYHRQDDSARLIQERQGTDQEDRQLREPIQQKLQALHLDSHRRFNS